MEECKNMDWEMDAGMIYSCSISHVIVELNKQIALYQVNKNVYQEVLMYLLINLQFYQSGYLT